MFENTEAQTSDQQKPGAGNNTWKSSNCIFHICDTLLLWNKAGAASANGPSLDGTSTQKMSGGA